MSGISEGDGQVDDSSLVGSGDDDLVSKKGVPIGQIKNGLMGELLRMVRSRAPLKDYPIFRVNDMKVADPSVGDAIDMTFNELCKFLWILAERRMQSVGGESMKIRRHARLPL
jgi:hypothetical protein